MVSKSEGVGRGGSGEQLRLTDPMTCEMVGVIAGDGAGKPKLRLRVQGAGRGSSDDPHARPIQKCEVANSDFVGRGSTLTPMLGVVTLRWWTTESR